MAPWSWKIYGDALIITYVGKERLADRGKQNNVSNNNINFNTYKLKIKLKLNKWNLASIIVLALNIDPKKYARDISLATIEKCMPAL